MSFSKEGKSINIFKLSNCKIFVSQIIWKRNSLANPTATDLQNRENFISVWALVVPPGPAYAILDFCMVERNFKRSLVFAHPRFYSLLMFQFQTRHIHTQLRKQCFLIRILAQTTSHTQKFFKKKRNWLLLYICQYLTILTELPSFFFN